MNWRARSRERDRFLKDSRTTLSGESREGGKAGIAYWRANVKRKVTRARFASCTGEHAMINDCLELFELDARSSARISKELGQQNSRSGANLCVSCAPNLHSFLYDMFQTALRWAESFFAVSWNWVCGVVEWAWSRHSTDLNKTSCFLLVIRGVGVTRY